MEVVEVVEAVVPTDGLFSREEELDDVDEETIEEVIEDKVSEEGTEEDRFLGGGFGGGALFGAGLYGLFGEVITFVESVKSPKLEDIFVGGLDLGVVGGAGEVIDDLSPCD